MTIQLPKDVENSIIAKVHGGLFPSMDAAMTEAARLLLEKLEQSPTAGKESTPIREATDEARKPIWEVADELRESIPAEEWARLPVDGASQHDHYIYGTKKRPAT